MPKIDVRSVHRVRAKGRVYFYAWKGRGAPRLLSLPGSREFVEELAAALATRNQVDESRVPGLCARYRASREYEELAKTTKRNWVRWLDRIQTHFGALSVRQFDRPRIRIEIRRWRDRSADTPRSADYGMQVLSRLMSFAVAEGLISTNPCSGIPNLYHVDRSELIWTGEDLSRLYEVASNEIIWAGKLAVLTGLRQADLLRLSWSHVQANSIEMQTGKSRRKPRTVIIPLYGDLRALLAEIPKLATTVLTNTRAQPWRSGFGDSWRNAALAAGITDLHFHDLRGTAATRLYVAGLSEREIAQILGWSEKRVERLIERYVKKDELLRDRIRRIDEAGAKLAKE